MTQCTAVAKKGKSCKLPAIEGKKYCYLHLCQRRTRKLAIFSTALSVTLIAIGLIADLTGIYDFFGNEKQQPTSSTDTPVPLVDLIARGDGFLRDKEFEKAIEYYTKALNIDPHDAKTSRNTGIAYIGLAMNDTRFQYFIDNCLTADKEHFMQALPYFDRAIEINPQDKEAYLYRGIVWYRRGNLHPMLGPPNNTMNAYSQFAAALELRLEESNIDPLLWRYQTSCAYYGMAKVMERLFEEIGGDSYRVAAADYIQKARDTVPSCIPLE